jgi:ferredoxin
VAQPVQPAAAVRYSSAGRLVIIGEAGRAFPVAAQLAGKLPRVLVITPPTEGGGEGDPPGAVEHIRARVTRVEGYLGHFGIGLQGAGQPVDLSQLLPREPVHQDLVLDLGDTPLVQQAVPPVGYFAPAGNTEALARALTELPTLVGEFDKPKYFNYDAAICAHGRSGIKACTRCIDACPTLAIRSVGDTIEVDPHACQGAGSCATACPSGAITYACPQPRDTLERLRVLLQTYREEGGRNAVLLIHDREQGADLLGAAIDAVAENVIPFGCEEAASVGMDVWLPALAYGASAVVVLLTPQVPAQVVRELEHQAGCAQAVLRGMGYAAERIRLLAADGPRALADALASPDFPELGKPAAFAGFNEKRAMIHFAVEHLHAQSSVPRAMVNLPAGAPFGEVSVDTRRCTLCMACVSQCPGNALIAGDDRPQLRFIEANCVQCGLCARSCPENAIAPSPRYIYDRDARSRVRTLYEEEPFLCVRCGKAFATRSTIERISARLRDHPMFQGDSLRRIQMCEDCRVIDMLESQDAEQPHFTPGVRS